MRRLLALAAIICLAVPSGAWAANDFSSDSSIKAVWRFESGAMTTDSKSTNTLTIVGNPLTDTVNFMEGAAAVDLEASDPYPGNYLYIMDAALSSGFPLKSGDTTKNIGICGWARYESFSPDGQIWAGPFTKYNSPNNWRSFAIFQATTGSVNHIRVILGYNNGISYEIIDHASDLALATKYHICVNYQNSDKSYSIRIRDVSGATVGVDKTGTATLDSAGLAVMAAEVSVGSYNVTGGRADAVFDEVVVANRVFTLAESDAIRAGTFGSSGGLTDSASDTMLAADAPFFVWGDSNKLCWIPNAEGNLAGYRVYLGASPSVLTTIRDVALTPATGAPCVGSEVGVTLGSLTLNTGSYYYAAVSAYNASAQESERSNPEAFYLTATSDTTAFSSDFLGVVDTITSTATAQPTPGVAAGAGQFQ